MKILYSNYGKINDETIYSRMNQYDKLHFMAHKIFETIYYNSNNDNFNTVSVWNGDILIKYYDLNEIIQESVGKNIIGKHISFIIVWIICKFANNDFHYYSVKINANIKLDNPNDNNKWCDRYKYYEILKNKNNKSNYGLYINEIYLNKKTINKSICFIQRYPI